MPSTKVTVQFVVGLLLAQVLAAVVAYFKAETNPAPSSFQGGQ